MKVIFWGTPDITIPFFDAVYSLRGIDIVSVVTRVDAICGRGRKLTAPPLKKYVKQLKNHVQIFQPTHLKNNLDFYNHLNSVNASIGIVVAYGNIIPKEYLSLFSLGLYNVHFSLLPLLRGATPVESSILEGHKESGISIFKIEESLDTGPLVLQEKISINPQDTTITLKKKMIIQGTKMIRNFLFNFQKFTLHPQIGHSTTTSLISKKDLRIVWTDSAELLERKIRAFRERGAYTILANGKKLKILSSIYIDESLSNVCGMIVKIDKDGFCVQTSQGILKILSVHLAGKKQMKALDFLRGYHFTIGGIL